MLKSKEYMKQPSKMQMGKRILVDRLWPKEV